MKTPNDRVGDDGRILLEAKDGSGRTRKAFAPDAREIVNAPNTEWQYAKGTPHAEPVKASEVIAAVNAAINAPADPVVPFVPEAPKPDLGGGFEYDIPATAPKAD